MYTLDTNAIIYYLKGDAAAEAALRKIFVQRTPLYVSAITELELFGFSSLTPEESDAIETLIKTVATIPVDSRIARTAGLLRRTYKLNVADSVIAATALFTNTKLVTRNIRDFQKIPNLVLLKI